MPLPDESEAAHFDLLKVAAMRARSLAPLVKARGFGMTPAEMVTAAERKIAALYYCQTNQLQGRRTKPALSLPKGVSAPHE